MSRSRKVPLMRRALLAILLLIPVLIVCGGDVEEMAKEAEAATVDSPTPWRANTSVRAGQGSEGIEDSFRCERDDCMGQFGFCDGNCKAEIRGTVEGASVQAQGEVVNGPFNFFSPIRRFALWCGGRIGSASRPSVECEVSTTQASETFVLDPPGAIYLRARTVVLGSGPRTTSAEVSVNCGDGAQSIAVDAPTATKVTLPTVDLGCLYDARLSDGLAEAGTRVAKLTLVVRPGPTEPCLRHEVCRSRNPATPFCSSDGCQAGLAGEPCVHDSQCDASQGFFCGSGGSCTDGGLGKNCVNDLDCTEDLACRSFQCEEAASCNPVAQTGCAAGEKCTWVDDRTRCVPDGSVPEGDPCVFGPAGADGSFDDCEQGLFCQGGLCQEICTVTFDSCSSGFCNADFFHFQDVRGDELGTCSGP